MTDRETAALDAATVAALAHLLGYPPLDAEPGNFLAELERLAGPGP